MHPLDQALALQPQGEGIFAGRTHPAWANMVGPFGGITAAQLLQAACLTRGAWASRWR
jgi:acyl-CoA thioesterase